MPAQSPPGLRASTSSRDPGRRVRRGGQLRLRRGVHRRLRPRRSPFNYGLAVILAYVGVKMLLSDVWHMPTWLSLAVIVGCLAATVGVSLLRPSERSHAEFEPA